MNWNIQSWQSVDYVAVLIILLATMLLMRNLLRRVLPSFATTKRGEVAHGCSSCGGCASPCQPEASVISLNQDSKLEN